MASFLSRGERSSHPGVTPSEGFGKFQRNQLSSKSFRKCEVNLPVPMNMTEFASSLDVELSSIYAG